ncbi:hypothetical protein JCM5350_007179 [Sporobolomyces pararoseus]
MIPLLPREVVRCIMLHTLSPPPPPKSSVEPVFLQPRTLLETRTVASLVLAFGKQHSQWINEVLWQEITLHSGKMVDKLIRTLETALDKSKLSRLVKVIHFAPQQYPFSPTPTPTPTPLQQSKQSFTSPENTPIGASPSQLSKLAPLLLEVETLSIRASASQAWFLNPDICDALRPLLNRYGFRNLEIDSDFLGFPASFYLLNLTRELKSLKLRNLNTRIDSTPFDLNQLPTTSLSLSYLRTLVVSHCDLTADQLAAILNSIGQATGQTSSWLWKLVLDHPVKERLSQATLDALAKIIPRLATLHFDLPNDSYMFSNLKITLPIETLFLHGLDPLKRLTLPASSLFGNEEFLVYLNTQPSGPVPNHLTLLITEEWDSRSSHMTVWEELTKIVEDHWLRNLEVLKIVGADTSQGESLVGSEGLVQRTERVNRDRDECGKRKLELRIEF